MLITRIDMPMPDTCHSCPFCAWFYDEGECQLIKKHFHDNNKLAYNRPKFCQLKEEKENKND